VLEGVEASEARVKELSPGRRVLHLATHGFFVQGECAAESPSYRGVGGLVTSTSPARPLANPLQLCGLALAGANQRARAGPTDEDGILTAEEVAALDLRSVEWAVLSGCDTGLGRLEQSEGVVGLRRAFRVAGARSVIMSLWAVKDEDAREWMNAFYRHRAAGKPTAEAARDSHRDRLAALRRAGLDTHPSSWAAFVAADDGR
jgi:CHAT domain-containing protein